MLAAFVMILVGALIIWIITEPLGIMLRLWLGIGCRLFQYTVFHSDDGSRGFYGLTFTNDELWQEKMLKGLKEMAEKEARSEGQ